MHELKYISSKGETVELDGPLTYVGVGEDIRANVWDYELSGHNVINIARKAREVSSPISTTREEMDRIQAIFDYDFGNNKPGKLVSNGWEQRALIAGSQIDWLFADKCNTEVPMILLDGIWRKLETLQLYPASGDADGTKVYPYTYDYYYASDYGSRYINIGDVNPVDFQMIIYGYAISPQITIGNNIYHFDLVIPEGGYLLVDSRPKPTVTLVTAEGVRTNEFAKAERGAGEGSGNYAFEKIKPGTNEIRWNDTFGVDLGIYHETGGLPNVSSNS